MELFMTPVLVAAFTALGLVLVARKAGLDARLRSHPQPVRVMSDRTHQARGNDLGAGSPSRFTWTYAGGDPSSRDCRG